MFFFHCLDTSLYLRFTQLKRSSFFLCPFCGFVLPPRRQNEGVFERRDMPVGLDRIKSQRNQQTSQQPKQGQAHPETRFRSRSARDVNLCFFAHRRPANFFVSGFLFSSSSYVFLSTQNLGSGYFASTLLLTYSLCSRPPKTTPDRVACFCLFPFFFFSVDGAHFFSSAACLSPGQRPRAPS